MAAVLTVLAAALAGLLASSVGSDSPAGDRPAAAGVRVEPPPGWESGAPGPARIGGLELEQAVVAKAAGARGRLVAGALPQVVFAQDLGRAAARSVTAVAGSAGTPDGVRLGRLEAYRWRGLDGRTTLFAAPTDAGAAVVACSGAPAALRACERQAATLEVEGAEGSALDTLAFYGGELHAAFARLERRRAAGAARLRSAARAGQRAGAAAALGRAHSSAAGSLGALAPPAAAAAAHERLEEALNGVATAYGRLARAARRGDSAAYASAARGAERLEAELHRAAERL